MEVQKGDIVTYNITVYNEGDRAGYPMEIIDQLPEGLHYEGMETATAQKFEANYESASNKVTFTRKGGREDKLAAYTQGKPASETLTIKFSFPLIFSSS